MLGPLEISPFFFTYVTIALLLYVFGGLFYRLYLSPIARFPGPKLAAATGLYELYYDVIMKGKYIWKIQEMHEKMGKYIVGHFSDRMSDDMQLHINDPEYFDQLYSSSAKNDKYPWYINAFGPTGSTFGTVKHEAHRIRRPALVSFFSRRMVVRLEHVIQDVIEKLCSRLGELRKTGEVVDLNLAYRCFTLDVITEYSFAQCWNLLDSPDFASDFVHGVRSIARVRGLARFIRGLNEFLDYIPMSVMAKISEVAAFTGRWGKRMEKQIIEISKGEGFDYHNKSHLTIFHELLNDKDLPPQEKTISRLSDEGQVVVFAGSETTAHTLSAIHFHLLDNPSKLERRRKNWKRRYLIRALAQHGKAWNSFLIWWTPVSMNPLFMHMNKEIFPDPHAFEPERWLKPGGKQLEKYLVPFGRGTRQCAGLNLAYAEIYLVTAVIFRKFNTELYKTTRRDVDIAHDFGVPHAALDSKGVRIIVK
ncbi:MAG: hypothetical protein M1836_006878 [Candelina mexicana]|nr:MAG: hypothetical protein M1836_006878 [Candelina mexicana]